MSAENASNCSRVSDHADHQVDLPLGRRVAMARSSEWVSVWDELKLSGTFCTAVLYDLNVEKMA